MLALVWMPLVRLVAEVKRIKMLVLDEADEMLSKGFKEQAGKQETS